MSKEYDEYIKEHCANVRKGFYWIKRSLPEVLIDQYHIHQNPHHWQHWVHLTDDGRPSVIALDMPYEYIIEMICDWWSFSWKSGDVFEIFDWYEKNKKIMKLSKRTRDTVEDILDKLEKKLIKVRGPRK